MDISNNIDLITLECLTNPGFYDKYNLKKNNPNKISKADRKFYKKRIINETKKMLRNDFDTPALKEIFNEYVISLVDYFKIVDKRDILQEDYKNNPPQDKAPQDKAPQDKEYYDNVLDEILDISDNNLNNLISPDQLLFKTSNETKKITLDNFVVKHNPPKENIIYPEQKEINLKEPSLKTKGLKTKGLKMKALKSTQIKSSVEKENIHKI
jgi:hypothetical protein